MHASISRFLVQHLEMEWLRHKKFKKDSTLTQESQWNSA
ncbi:hypothetical protein PRUB_a1929 [Pseudoalteromonas rubra]|uniref:Uncharacterized protein n=1 Tax=Pseudoalteromonas rubra TaxID=43658 RepID=A0A8T0CGZ4_9GAMM|nr:hypothetical protein PRUB_a1929 [Pseudoalteromonas rubra]